MPTLPHILVICSFTLSAFGAYSYIRDTLFGKTKPNKMSWALWAFAPIASTYIAYTAGADPWSIVRVFAAGFSPLLVLCVSFLNPQSYWKLHWFDYVCGCISIVAFAFWLGADSPRTAILLLACADFFASIPVIEKAWNHPHTETGITYLLGIPIFLLNIPAIQVWNIENSAFQIYLLCTNVLLVFSVYRYYIASHFKKIFNMAR